MRIERLSLQHFRNVERVDLTVRAPVVVLQGDNGQGKTNLLEALYLCATGRSFRNATASQMCMHGQVHGSVSAMFSRQGVRHEVQTQLRGAQRLLRVDGRALRQSTQLLQLVNVVAFFPDDLRIVKGSPEERRRFLDRAVANHAPAFAEAALCYHRALKARNAILRSPQAPDRALVEVYDAQLVRFGGVMHSCRQATLQALTPVAQGHFSSMLPQAGALTLELQPGVEGAARAAHFSEHFTQALQRSYPRDRARGMTLCGPHRADLLCQMEGREMRLYASQGQQRALVLALKLAEVVCLRTQLGSAPILLLDDVSSELDAERTRRLFEVVAAVQSQVWVSTTGVVPLPVPADAEHWRVQEGGLAPLKRHAPAALVGASA